MTVNIKTTEVADVEQIELFKIDGKSFTIQNRPRINVSLKYLKNARTLGAEQAGAILLEDLLGAEAFDALCECDTLTTEEWNEIVALAQRITVGSVETPKA